MKGNLKMRNNNVTILAIDTSCDETAAAISRDDVLFSNTLSSSMEFQNEWGGVVPIIAKRNHINRIDGVIKRALRLASIDYSELDAVAVTYGPGLAIALEVGIAKAREISIEYNIPIIGVNHMAGHIYANFARRATKQTFSGLDVKSAFPLIALLISGGHTELVYMKDHLKYEIIGHTLDDSVGEAFDKIARMLALGYPGGPIIERLAKLGNENAFTFPVSMAKSGDLNLSYSGLKTAVMRVIQEIGNPEVIHDETEKSKYEAKAAQYRNEPYAPSLSKKPVYRLSKQDSVNIAASFQKAAAAQLVIKSIEAVKKYPVNTFLLGGGVVNNIYIRKYLRKELSRQGVRLYYPRNNKLLSDNAGMIAISGYYQYKNSQFADLARLDRNPNLILG